LISTSLTGGWLTFDDERDQLAAAADARGEGAVGPLLGVLGAEAFDRGVALGAEPGREFFGLGGLAVEFAGSG
jgi:hypothetical protein